MVSAGIAQSGRQTDIPAGGAAGAVLAKNSSNAGDAGWTTSAGVLPATPILRSGYWNDNRSTGISTSSLQNPGGYSFYHPWYLGQSATITNVGVNINSVTAGAQCVLGLFNVGSTWTSVGSQLLLTPTQTSPAAGVQTWSGFNVSLTPGWYLWGIGNPGTAQIFYYSRGASDWRTWVWHNASTGSTTININVCNGLQYSTSGALPANINLQPVSLNVPIIYFKVA